MCVCVCVRETLRACVCKGVNVRLCDCAYFCMYEFVCY